MGEVSTETVTKTKKLSTFVWYSIVRLEVCRCKP